MPKTAKRANRRMHVSSKCRGGETGNKCDKYFNTLRCNAYRVLAQLSNLKMQFKIQDVCKQSSMTSMFSSKPNLKEAEKYMNELSNLMIKIYFVEFYRKNDDIKSNNYNFTLKLKEYMKNRLVTPRNEAIIKSIKSIEDEIDIIFGNGEFYNTDVIKVILERPTDDYKERRDYFISKLVKLVPFGDELKYVDKDCGLEKGAYISKPQLVENKSAEALKNEQKRRTLKHLATEAAGVVNARQNAPVVVAPIPEEIVLPEIDPNAVVEEPAAVVEEQAAVVEEPNYPPPPPPAEVAEGTVQAREQSQAERDLANYSDMAGGRRRTKRRSQKKNRRTGRK